MHIPKHGHLKLLSFSLNRRVHTWYHSPRYFGTSSSPTVGGPICAVMHMMERADTNSSSMVEGNDGGKEQSLAGVLIVDDHYSVHSTAL